VGRSSSGISHPTRAHSSAGSPPLSALDRRILDLLAFLRVLTVPQLARLSPETPPRTLRYRTARLAKLGLVGRTRPYRERGSAPDHLWPTRKGEAITEGGRAPRGGERREPNPLFLAHAAAISEL
jgi:Replication-relaxation